MLSLGPHPRRPPLLISLSHFLPEVEVGEGMVVVDENLGRLTMADPVCQICGVQGHVANICYYRFDKDCIQKNFNPSPYLGGP